MPSITGTDADQPAIQYKETEMGCLRLTYQKAVFFIIQGELYENRMCRCIGIAGEYLL